MNHERFGRALTLRVLSLDRVRDEEAAERRFWAMVERSDGCWRWRGWCQESGYGRFAAFGRDFKAHRFAYLLTYGSLPYAALVCHTCDNPSCVNPDHLFLGTAADNFNRHGGERALAV